MVLRDIVLIPSNESVWIDEPDYDPGEAESWVSRLSSQESVGTIYYYDFAGRGCIPNLCALYLGLHVKNVAVPLRRRPWMMKNVPSQMLPMYKKPDDTTISDNDATRTMSVYICGLEATNDRLCPVDAIQDEIFDIGNSPPIHHSRGNVAKGDKYPRNTLNPFWLQSIPGANNLGNLQESLDEWAAATSERYAELGRKLSALPGPFFSGTHPSYGDFCIWSSMEVMATLTGGKWILTLPSRMKTFFEQISALPEVKEWILVRKERKYYQLPDGAFPGKVSEIFYEELNSGSSTNSALAKALAKV